MLKILVGLKIILGIAAVFVVIGLFLMSFFLTFKDNAGWAFGLVITLWLAWIIGDEIGRM